MAKEIVNEHGLHNGDVVGYPTHTDGMPVVHPARIVLEVGRSGAVHTNLDLGYVVAGSVADRLQRVLPGMEQEISHAVDTVRQASEERRHSGPDLETPFGRWKAEFYAEVNKFTAEQREVKKLLRRGEHHLKKAGIAAAVGMASALIQPVAFAPFVIEVFRQFSLSDKWTQKAFQKSQEYMSQGLPYFPTIEEVEERYQASLPKPLERQLVLFEAE